MSHPAPEDSVPSTPPAPDYAPLQPPTPLTGLTPQGSLAPSSNALLVPETEKGLEENETDQPEHPKPPFLKRVFWLPLVIAVVIILAVVLPVYFTVIKPKNNTASGVSKNPDNSSPSPSPTSSSGNPKSPNDLTTGGDGSTVTMDNGTQFTYHNSFGGFCACIPFPQTGGDLTFSIAGVWDPAHPFNDNAQPNSWTPPLNTTWKWGTNQLYG